MKSILYVTPFSFAVSGADQSLTTIVAEMVRKDFNVHIAHPPDSPFKARFEKAGGLSHSIPLFRLKRTRNPLYWLGFLFWLPIEVLLFIHLIRRRKIDLIHINMESTVSAGLAGKILGLPVVLHYRGKTRDNPKWFFDRYLPILHWLSDQIFVISQATAKGFFDRGITRNVKTLYNAIDLSQFTKERNRKYLLDRKSDWQEKKIITFIGRWDPQKRIEDLIHAMATVSRNRSDTVLLLVGGDSGIPEEAQHRKMLNELISRLKEKPEIHFWGRDERIPEILSGSDIFVLPSVDEGFGRVVVEAMAVGVPVIVADSGALPELVQSGKFGEVVPPCNPDRLAAAIEKILREPPAKERIETIRKYAADHFGIEKHVNEIISTYNQLIQ